MIVVSYGGGTDSTALLIEAHRRGIRPDLILFADTGSEMPHTYAYLPVVAEWCAGVDFPEIQVVKWIHQKNGFVPLHVRSLQRSQLPSKAYGHVGCTSKWKQDPLDGAVAKDPEVIAALEAGRTVERWLGYDAREGARHAKLRHKPPPPKCAAFSTAHAPASDGRSGSRPASMWIVSVQMETANGRTGSFGTL